MGAIHPSLKRKLPSARARRAKGRRIESIERRGWHSFRRNFVNDLKPDTPMADLCYLGGWKSPLTVMTVYQQPDQVTMRTALSNRDERRASTVR